MASQCVTKHTVVGLEGGEFLLHPEANAIMEWFKDNHPNYTLLSNCLAPQKVIEAVRLYHPSHLYVSLDGNKETYKAMWRKRSIPTHSEWLYPLTFDAGKGLKEA